MARKMEWQPATAEISGPSEGDGHVAGLEIMVIFTSEARTPAALKTAGKLAGSLGATITLIVPQVVPYPLPLTSPDVPLDFQKKRFSEIAAASPVDVRVELCLCRDRSEMLDRMLPRRSIVVIGGRKRWWPTDEQRLARQLQSRHEVIFAETV